MCGQDFATEPHAQSWQQLIKFSHRPPISILISILISSTTLFVSPNILVKESNFLILAALPTSQLLRLYKSSWPVVSNTRSFQIISTTLLTPFMMNVARVLWEFGRYYEAYEDK